MKNRLNFKNEYIDYNYYLNYKKNYFLLKYYIYRHNKEYLDKKKSIKFKINNLILDNEQKEAIFSDEINTLVLAGAGSGKTLTITAKIKYLIEEKNVKENEILCISFTNDSVNNLKQKIDYNVDIFTFHKLSLEILKDYNVPINIVNNYLEYIIDEIFLSSVNNINLNTLKYFNNIISSFINLFKNYGYDISFFDNIRLKNNKKILQVIKKIYLIYEEELSSSNLIDFNDIINLSNKYIQIKGLKRYYKYIIIDEFQDISYNRYKLIKTIKDSCNSKLFVVGDDYQSIYKFAGSDLEMISKFKKYFGHTKIIKINNTYRNSNELITVMYKFIMKNKRQIKKKLVSNKHSNKPIKIIYYSKNIDIKLKKLLDKLKDNVMILARNNFDINLVLDNEVKLDNDMIKYKGKLYCFKTVHKSKGLEEENVIILNLVDDLYGFPNKKDDGILKILYKKNRYLYEEERRLFYVALTRTKNNVYLFTSKEKPSIFVKEIIKNSKKYIEVLDL